MFYFCNDRLFTNELDGFLYLEVFGNSFGVNNFLNLAFFHAVKLSETLVFVCDFFFGNLEIFKSRDLFKCETCLYLAFRIGSHLCSELVEIQTGVLEVCLEVETVHSQSVVVVANEVFCLVDVHAFGNVALELFDKSLNESFVNMSVGVLFVSFFSLLLYVSLVLVKRVEFGNILREIVVESRKLGVLDIVELALEYGFLACEFLSVVIFGECYVNFKFVAYGVTANLIFKSGDELTGAELELVSLSLAALKGNVVNKAFKVVCTEVVLLCGTVAYFDHTGVTGLYSLKLFFNFFVGSVGNGTFYCDSEIVGNFNFGLCEVCCGKNNAALINGNNVEFGTAYDNSLFVSDSGGVSVGNNFVDSVFVEYFLAVHLFDDSAGSLAFTESGDSDVLG